MLGQLANAEEALDEIVVTASKRGIESLQEAGYNVSAISGAALARTNARSVEDISRALPGLSTLKLGPSNSQIVIRGLVSEEETDSLASIYIDEVPVPSRAGFNVRAPNLGLYDLERIELLRGPQGTLYGAGAQGGTLRYITTKPNTSRIEGYLDASVGARSGDAGQYLDINGVVNIPLIENTFAVRAMAAYQDIDGRIDRPSLGLRNTDDSRTAVVRVSALLDLNEATDLSAVYFRQVLDQSDSSLAAVDRDAVPLNVLEPFEDELTYYSVTLRHRFATGSVTVTLSEFERDNFYSFDVSRFFAPLNARVNQPFQSDTTSGELRFASNLDGSIQLLAGFYFEDSETDFATDRGVGTFIDPTLGQPDPSLPLFFDRSNERLSTNRALFGETTFDINDKLSILFGARFFDVERKRTEIVRVSPFAMPGTNEFPVSKETESVFKVELAYRASEATLMYFSISEGFRNGGANDVNLASAFGSTIPDTYDSDLVTNFEFGWKGFFLGGKHTISAAAYYMIWDDIQTFLSDATGAFGYITNAGEADLTGIEVEAAFRPQMAPDFSLSANMRYSRQELSEDAPLDPGNPFSGLEGDRIPNTFEFEFGLNAEKRQRIGRFDGFVNFDASYQSEADTRFRPEDPITRQWGDFWLLGASIGVRSERWSGALYGRNLLDERGILSWAVEPLETNIDRVIVTPPREIGLRLRYEF